MKYLSLLLVITGSMFIGACSMNTDNQTDSARTRTRFTKHFGFDAPTTVTNMHYSADKHGTQIAFNADQRLMEQIVSSLGLQQKPIPFEFESPKYKWWNVSAMKKLKPYWKDTDLKHFWVLWYDGSTQELWFLEINTEG